MEIYMILLNFVRGFAMALANSVPGVSGGTVAFLMGFYDEFINSLDALMTGSREERKNAIIFLIKIGIGMAVGMVLSILALAALFETNIYKISSLFLGFVIFAIPIVVKEEKECLKKYVNIIFAVIGIAVVVAMTYFAGNTILSGGVNLSVEELNIGMCIYLFISGAIAIVAMVLPGISGSTLLLIMGVYIPIIDAVKECMHFNFNYVPACAIFCVGILVGIVSCIKLIKKCLDKFRSQTVYLIIGLMIGSLYAIVQGPTTLEVPKAAMSLANNFNLANVLFFLTGGVIIFGLEMLKKVQTKKETNK